MSYLGKPENVLLYGENFLRCDYVKDLKMRRLSCISQPVLNRINTALTSRGKESMWRQIHTHTHYRQTEREREDYYKDIAVRRP